MSSLLMIQAYILGLWKFYPDDEAGLALAKQELNQMERAAAVLASRRVRSQVKLNARVRAMCIQRIRAHSDFYTIGTPGLVCSVASLQDGEPDR
jgi:hypothetical protein